MTAHSLIDYIQSKTLPKLHVHIYNKMTSRNTLHTYKYNKHKATQHYVAKSKYSWT